MFATSLATLSLGFSAPSDLVVTPTAPLGWSRAGVADSGSSIDVLIQVRRRNIENLHEVALAVSTPGHARYGHYLTKEQVDELTAPAAADVDAVRSWLAPAALSVSEKSAGVLMASLHVGRASSLLGTVFGTLHSATEGRRLVRAGTYTVPARIADKIEAIHGLHGVPLPSAPTPRPKAGEPMSTPPPVVPSVLIETYGLSKAKASGSVKVRQAVAEFQGQTMNQTDVTAFFAKYVSGAAAGDDQVYAFHGEPPQGGDGVEAMLDIEYMMGITPGLKTEFYEQMNQNFCGDLKNWTTLLLATDDVPLVHSVSYGWQGNLSQIGCPDEQVASIDADYATLAAKGITIVFASGDSGSGYAPPRPPVPPQCPHPAGKAGIAFDGATPTSTHNFTLPKSAVDEAASICCEQAGFSNAKAFQVVDTGPAPHAPGQEEIVTCEVFAELPSKTKPDPKTTSGSAPSAPPPPPGPATAEPLWPSWPASSPWVTAVGATRFQGDKVGNAEAAVSTEDHFGSGGGFSLMWDAPKWQKDFTAKYFTTVDNSTLPDPTKASYPKGGRGTPDVAALGTGYALIVRGNDMPGVGGTSASAPVFAAMVSLINDALVAAGKPAVGFMNPLIYQNPQAFFDVTVGSNKVGRGGPPLPYGFNCSTGWDPVTGMGTPKFEKLLAAAQAAMSAH